MIIGNRNTDTELAIHLSNSKEFRVKRARQNKLKMKNTQIHDSFFDVYQTDFKIASFRYCSKFKSTIVCGLFLKIWVVML